MTIKKSNQAGNESKAAKHCCKSGEFIEKKENSETPKFLKKSAVPSESLSRKK